MHSLNEIRKANSTTEEDIPQPVLEIALQDVESSNIVAAGFRPSDEASTGTLRIKFANGAHYDYANVTEEVAQAMFEAESIGKYFHAIIRPTYTGVAVRVIE